MLNDDIISYVLIPYLDVADILTLEICGCLEGTLKMWNYLCFRDFDIIGNKHDYVVEHYIKYIKEAKPEKRVTLVKKLVEWNLNVKNLEDKGFMRNLLKWNPKKSKYYLNYIIMRRLILFYHILYSRLDDVSNKGDYFGYLGKNTEYDKTLELLWKPNYEKVNYNKYKYISKSNSLFSIFGRYPVNDEFCNFLEAKVQL